MSLARSNPSNVLAFQVELELKPKAATRADMHVDGGGTGAYTMSLIGEKGGMVDGGVSGWM